MLRLAHAWDVFWGPCLKTSLWGKSIRLLFYSWIYFNHIMDSKISIGHLLIYQRSHCLKGGECRAFWVWIDEKAALGGAVCFWSVSLVAKGCNHTVIHWYLISKIPADDSHQTDCFGKQFISLTHKSYSSEQGEDEMKQKWFTEQAMSSLCCTSCLCGIDRNLLVGLILQNKQD